jgi:hypothetical protein
MKNGYSIVTTADGPRGPKYEFKAGTVLMARVAGVPIIPIGCAADRAWYLKRWDDFLIPKPFARIVIAIGEPVPVPRDIPLDALEPVRLNVQEAVMSLMRDSEKILEAVKDYLSETFVSYCTDTAPDGHICPAICRRGRAEAASRRIQGQDFRGVWPAEYRVENYQLRLCCDAYDQTDGRIEDDYARHPERFFNVQGLL